MKYGIVYTWKQYNKINGTLFYCFEYFKKLQKHLGDQIQFYIVGIPPKDLDLVKSIFSTKYNCPIDGIVPLKTVIDVYQLQLDKTLVLDVKTCLDAFVFLTGEIHCFSNETHEINKGRKNITFYGSYDYQRYDVFCYLKLNFDIFNKAKNVPGIFVSCLDQKLLQFERQHIERMYKKPIYIKKSHNGTGDIFSYIDQVHYIHTTLDTNNRIIPEAKFHNKIVTIDDRYSKHVDSCMLRYNDICTNGLANYTLTDDDAMIVAMRGGQ